MIRFVNKGIGEQLLHGTSSMLSAVNESLDLVWPIPVVSLTDIFTNAKYYEPYC
jgi:hypothetical protein